MSSPTLDYSILCLRIGSKKAKILLEQCLSNDSKIERE